MKTIFQVSAGGIVYKKIVNRKLKIENFLWLICQHSQHHGWVFPKGFVGDKNKNESKEEAAIREVKEEGGVKTRIVKSEPIKTQYEYKFNGTLFKKTVYLFLMEYQSGDPKDHDFEMSEAKFITAPEVKKLLTYDSDKIAFETILKNL
jgi:ADP-ribose pyrophosphatase YjhB (NUDIX family)